MIKKANLLVVSFALIIFLVPSLFAQVTGGSVTGSILDANGAVVPNATVTVKNKNTGVTLRAQTTGSGSFTFPNVAPGDYTVSIEAGGFQPLEQEIKVTLNKESAVNAVLAVGGVGTNVVDVTAAGEGLIQTESSTLGTNFETAAVENLPTFGNQNALALLAANVVVQASGTAGSGGVVGGVRPRYNIFTVDGVDNNDPSVTGPQTSVIQDAIGEFTLLQNNFSAEFGQGGGGQFVTITKSGTNEYHGAGFVYLQNQKLNATSSSEEQLLNAGTISEKPRFRDVRFGVTTGGPIIKNKLFFFAAVQDEIVSQDASSTSFLAPTGPGLAQISGLPGASPFVVNLLQNNLTLADNQTRTVNVLGTPIPFGDVSIVVPGGSDDIQFQTNVDWNPTDRDQFRFRFSFDNFNAVEPGNGSPIFNNNIVFQSRLFSATYIKAFSSSLVNDLRLSYRRAVSDFPLVDQTLNNFPNIEVGNLNLAIGPGGNLPQSGIDNSYQLYDSLSYIVGPHSFKFGAEYRNIISASNFLPRSRGDYVYTNFDELIQDLAPTAVDLRGTGSGGFVASHEQYYAFVQDDWKITPNLTFNLGLRYEYVTLPRDTALQALNSVSDVPGLITFGVPKTDKNNFAPRLGFAYSPNFGGRFGRFLFGENRASSIRGNFAVSYTQVFQNLNLLALPPQFQAEIDVDTAQQLTGINLQNNFLQQGGVPAIFTPPTTTADARALTGSFITDQRFGEIYSFTLSYQRELFKNTALEVRYLGTRGRHLPIQQRLAQPRSFPQDLVLPTFLSQPSAAQLANLPTLGSIVNGPTAFTNPDFDPFGFGGSITAFTPIGNSVYDSGSVSLTRRFDRGLSFTAAYTYSRLFSDSDNELFTSTVNPRRPQDAFNLSSDYSISAFDVPHRFVISGNYEPSWFKNSDNAFLKNVVGNWIFAPIFQAQSGQPFTPQSGVDSNLNFDSAGDRTIVNPNGVQGTGSAVRAIDRNGNIITTVNANGQNVPVTLTFGNLFSGRLDGAVGYIAVNPNAQHIQAGFGARATAGRNTLRSNGFNRTDLTVLKNFQFGEERYKIQIGAEVFNLLNQRIRTIGGFGGVNFAFPNVSSPLFNDLSIGNFGGRTIQLRAKLIF